MRTMYHSAVIDKVTRVCSVFPVAYAAGDMSATFSKMEMQLSPFLPATFGILYLQKTDFKIYRNGIIGYQG